MPKHDSLVELPVQYVTTREHGKHGRFRYKEHHLTVIDGQPAVDSTLLNLEDQEIHEGSVIVPQRSVDVLGEYATKLAGGIAQRGLYTGRQNPEFNCATFVHDMLGVPYDSRHIGQPEGIGAWTETPMDPATWQPSPGEAVVYRFDTPLAGWTHWALGAGELGVMGVTGANGATISLAQSPDYAKGLGHTIPHLAVPVASQ